MFNHTNLTTLHISPVFQHLPEPNRACLVGVYAFLIWNNLCDLVYQTPTKSYQSQIPVAFGMPGHTYQTRPVRFWYVLKNGALVDGRAMFHLIYAFMRAAAVFDPAMLRPSTFLPGASATAATATRLRHGIRRTNVSFTASCLMA